MKTAATVRATRRSTTRRTDTLIRFWGVRGSIPTPGPATVRYGGNTSCVEVRAAGQIIILDAGTGLRLLGQQLLAEFGERPLNLTLLLTHTHWDHIQGLPFFPPMYKPRNRLRILGFEGARHGLDNVLTGQMESPFFPIGLSEVPANVRIEELKNTNFSIGSVRVEACRAHHPGVCVGYRLYTPSGSVAFFPDIEPRRDARRNGTLTLKKGVTDPDLVEFLRDVDTLIMDAQYERAEYQHHVGWGHGCLDDVVDVARAARARRLFLFHHDPEHDDRRIERMVKHARKLAVGAKPALKVEAAREGLAVRIG